MSKRIPDGAANLLLIGQCDGGRLVVGIEAKADETFDADLVRWRAARLRTAGSRSRATRRCHAGVLRDDPRRGPFRSARCDSACPPHWPGPWPTRAPSRPRSAALVVHEFVTPETTAAKRQINARDLAAFVARLGGTAPSVGSWLLGPFKVPGNDYSQGMCPSTSASSPPWSPTAAKHLSSSPPLPPSKEPPRRAPPPRSRRGRASARRTYDS